MFRIDGPTAAAALPNPADVSGVPGYFTDGDPTTSRAPTTVTGDWANMLQEEVVAVVLAAGLTLSKTDHGQLLAALTSLFAPATSPSFTHSESAWLRVGPDGFIEAGGTHTLGTTTEQAVSFDFPTPFPNACLGLAATMISTSDVTGDTQLQEVSLTPTTANLFIQSDTHPFSDATAFRWRAWGY